MQFTAEFRTVYDQGAEAEQGRILPQLGHAE